MRRSPDFEQNLDRDISDFRIYSQSFISKNCHNSRTGHDIDMEFGPVNKLVKKNTATSKKFDDHVMPTNCHVIVFFPIYGKSAATRKPGSGRMVIKLTFLLPISFDFTKTENRTRKSLTQLSYYCFEERYYLCQKMLTSVKLRWPWY